MIEMLKVCVPSWASGIGGEVGEGDVAGLRDEDADGDGVGVGDGDDDDDVAGVEDMSVGNPLTR